MAIHIKSHMEAKWEHLLQDSMYRIRWHPLKIGNGGGVSVAAATPEP